ncbi:MAG: alpha/beta fold hydrolase [Chloroflexota bacterium]
MTTPKTMPPPLRATADDLPAVVVAALSSAPADMAGARRSVTEAAGIPWAVAEWGEVTDRALVLVHGVTSNAETFWRVAPAVAAAGYHVLAVDLPGHGLTGHWTGRHRFEETAQDLAAFLRAAGFEDDRVAVLGHSWGGMVAAALPAAGFRPSPLILLDPPALPVEAMELMTHDPVEQSYQSLPVAITTIREANPEWPDGDVYAKALGLTQFDGPAVRAVLIENGDWDGGLGALAYPAARDVPIWLIRGEFPMGGLIPEAAVPAFAARIGADRILTIAGAPHSPHRMFPEATVLAILRALGAA